jgi:hypothetical protein
MKGSIIASCGHTLKDDEDIVSVCYADTICDAIEGFKDCVVYASYCPACARDLESRGLALTPGQVEAKFYSKH